MNYNRVILLGNLTRDPVLKYTAANTAICDFGIAVNHKWKGQDGQQKEDVCFVDCTIFGKSAETFNQYCSKGKPVLVEGRLHLDRWEDNDGNKRSKHKVNVQGFQFVGQRSDTAASPPQQAPPPMPPNNNTPQAPPVGYDGAPINEPPSDVRMPSGPDIPFMLLFCLAPLFQLI